MYRYVLYEVETRTLHKCEERELESFLNRDVEKNESIELKVKGS